MLERLLAFGILALAFGGIAAVWRNVRVRRLSRERLTEAPVDVASVEEEAKDAPPSAQPFQQRHPMVPAIVGGAVAALVWVGLRGGLFYPIMFGVIAAIIAHEVQWYLETRKSLQIETQLADAIDLMVASLRAGAGSMNALEYATEESRPPLRPQLEEVLGRVRFGEDQRVVYRALEARVPLESFRLFASALSVHHEVGGSLAPTLAIVGKIIRDRTELSRRVRALTIQARASIMAVTGTTYFIGLIMWRTDPERMEQFVSTTLGSFALSAAVILQGVGIMWASAMSRLKY